MATEMQPDQDSIDQYLTLMEAFQTRAIDTATFERRYLDLFQYDETFQPDAVFRALEDVFLAIDDYYEDPALRDPGDLDEDQLRDRVRAALATLQHLLSPA
jgi:hypothetical protein